MILTIAFALLLLAVVGVYYLAPKRQLCGGCGAPRQGTAPLCSACGWIYDPVDDDEDDGEPEAVEKEAF